MLEALQGAGQAEIGVMEAIDAAHPGAGPGLFPVGLEGRDRLVVVADQLAGGGRLPGPGDNADGEQPGVGQHAQHDEQEDHPPPGPRKHEPGHLRRRQGRSLGQGAHARSPRRPRGYSLVSSAP